MYIGRFAPSPSGPLHFGSLVCALASYLDAKKHGGQWLVRIEDIDPPREQAGASNHILTTLLNHGLHWDQHVVFQSQRSEYYHRALNHLHEQNLTYQCHCNRQRLKTLNGVYDGHCTTKHRALDTPHSIRLNIQHSLRRHPVRPPKDTHQDIFEHFVTDQHVNTGELQKIQYTDLIQGPVQQKCEQVGDFVVHRKDKLFAYQLAVTVDDMAQNITHIIRGYDLLDTTPPQIILHHILGTKMPMFGHIPIIVNENNQKLSKQNHAPSLNNTQPTKNIIRALRALNLTPPSDLPINKLLLWATEQWNRNRLHTQTTRTQPSDNFTLKEQAY